MRPDKRSDERYSINNETLALTIDSVQPSDAADPYVCDVQVLINHQYYRYEKVNQTLHVFGE